MKIILFLIKIEISSALYLECDVTASMSDMMFSRRVVRKTEPMFIDDPLEDIRNLFDFASPLGDD